MTRRRAVQAPVRERSRGPGAGPAVREARIGRIAEGSRDLQHRVERYRVSKVPSFVGQRQANVAATREQRTCGHRLGPSSPWASARNLGSAVHDAALITVLRRGAWDGGQGGSALADKVFYMSGDGEGHRPSSGWHGPVPKAIVYDVDQFGQRTGLLGHPSGPVGRVGQGRARTVTLSPRKAPTSLSRYVG
jgi:hypothetical protein